MPANNVTAFVGQHAKNFRRRINSQDKTGIYKYPLSTRDKGVQSVIIDDVNTDSLGVQSCCREQWRCKCPDAMFYFCVTNKRNPGNR